jgi:hypothetical protein
MTIVWVSLLLASVVERQRNWLWSLLSTVQLCWLGLAGLSRCLIVWRIAGVGKCDAATCW